MTNRLFYGDKLEILRHRAYSSDACVDLKCCRCGICLAARAWKCRRSKGRIGGRQAAAGFDVAHCDGSDDSACLLSGRLGAMDGCSKELRFSCNSFAALR